MPAQVWSHCRNTVEPAGMAACGDQVQAGYGAGLTTSCGIDSLEQSKSPIRHSPKAIVLLVPSWTSRTPIGGAVVAGRKLESSPPPNMKMPLHCLELPTQLRVEPTDAK